MLKQSTLVSRLIFFAILVQVCFHFISCKKQDENDLLNIKKELLTADTLVYEEQILNWNLASQRVTFKRGSNTNSSDFLKDYWIKYDMNGSFKAAFNNVQMYSGQWEFLEDGTKLRMWSTELSYDNTYEVIKLISETFEWYDSEHYAFYRQIPKP
jgi:hypothetical protein